MSYLHKGMDPTSAATVVRRIKKLVNEESLYFDIIVLTGMSGAIFSAALAMALDKPVVILRKPDDNGTHGRQVEIPDTMRDFDEKRYLFVDDGIASGRTVVRVVEEMRSRRCECGGIILYDVRRVGNGCCPYAAKLVNQLGTRYVVVYSIEDRSQTVTWEDGTVFPYRYIHDIVKFFAGEMEQKRKKP